MAVGAGMWLRAAPEKVPDGTAESRAKSVASAQ